MDFQDVMAARRAVNFFDTEADVPQDALAALLETAARSPSSFNLQPWRVAVLRDPAQKAKLRALAWDQPKVTEAPVILLFLADREAWKMYSPSFERQFSYLLQAGRYTSEQRDEFALRAVLGVVLECLAPCKHEDHDERRPRLADEHRVKGGKFGWDGKRWRLELDPEPVNYSGVEAATFNQAANRPEFTIGSGTGITINDMRSVKL